MEDKDGREAMVLLHPNIPCTIVRYFRSYGKEATRTILSVMLLGGKRSPGPRPHRGRRTSRQDNDLPLVSGCRHILSNWCTSRFDMFQHFQKKYMTINNFGGGIK